MSEAREIVMRLHGEWSGNSGNAPCPVCQPDGRKGKVGLSVTEKAGRVLIHCHKSGCSFATIMAQLRAMGVAPGQGTPVQRSQEDIDRDRQKDRERRDKTQRLCNDYFDQAKPITGTPAETYLIGRGIRLDGQKVRKTLRFHPGLRHGPSGQELPCMLARIRGANGRAMGLHRTYLRPDGSGKADVKCSKMMLGEAAGGAVRFGPDRPIIALAEGIETALSIGMASRLTVWACLSTSGMKSLILPPPPLAGVVVIAADHDEAGIAAAEQTAGRLEGEGRAVSIITPPRAGDDFNDVLRA